MARINWNDAAQMYRLGTDIWTRQADNSMRNEISELAKQGLTDDVRANKMADIYDAYGRAEEGMKMRATGRQMERENNELAVMRDVNAIREKYKKMPTPELFNSDTGLFGSGEYAGKDLERVDMANGKTRLNIYERGTGNIVAYKDYDTKQIDPMLERIKQKAMFAELAAANPDKYLGQALQMGLTERQIEEAAAARKQTQQNWDATHALDNRKFAHTVEDSKDARRLQREGLGIQREGVNLQRLKMTEPTTFAGENAVYTVEPQLDVKNGTWSAPKFTPVEGVTPKGSADKRDAVAKTTISEFEKNIGFQLDPVKGTFSMPDGLNKEVYGAVKSQIESSVRKSPKSDVNAAQAAAVGADLYNRATALMRADKTLSSKKAVELAMSQSSGTPGGGQDYSTLWTAQ